MKVLFICRYNIARSQLAQAIFNRIVKKDFSKSAGVDKTYNGDRVGKVNRKVVEAGKEIGLKLDLKKSKYVTKDLVDWADKIIVFNQYGDFPDYLSDSNKVEYHYYKDPAHENLDVYRKTRDWILNWVEDFVEKNKKQLIEDRQIEN
jgi:protein-tyrosine-phosphatase